MNEDRSSTTSLVPFFFFAPTEHLNEKRKKKSKKKDEKRRGKKENTSHNNRTLRKDAMQDGKITTRWRIAHSKCIHSKQDAGGCGRRTKAISSMRRISKKKKKKQTVNIQRRIVSNNPTCKNKIKRNLETGYASEYPQIKLFIPGYFQMTGPSHCHQRLQDQQPDGYTTSLQTAAALSEKERGLPHMSPGVLLG